MEERGEALDKDQPVKFAEDTNVSRDRELEPDRGSHQRLQARYSTLRQVRHAHLGEQRPGGLFTEVAAYYAWKGPACHGSTWAELLTSTMEQGRRAVREGASTTASPDPVLGAPMKPALDSWEERRRRRAEASCRASPPSARLRTMSCREELA